MTRTLKFVPAIILMILFFSCKEDCSEGFDFSAETQTEHDNWRAADAAYSDSITLESCTNLNKVSDEYITALMNINGCIPDEDRESYNNRLGFLEAQKIPNCN